MSIATEPIPIAFEGRTLLARPGQSLAALLTGAGVLALRETPTGAARASFAGWASARSAWWSWTACRTNGRAC